MEQEIWKDVSNYEGLYQISNLGNVKSLHFIKERILKFKISEDGYRMVGLSKNGIVKTIMVHKLVAMEFLNHIPKGNILVINHKNFIRQDNELSNLEIITNRKNTDRKHLKHSSIYTGVCWDKSKNKWFSKIYINGKYKNFGYFKDELEASLAYENELINLTQKNPATQ